MLALKNKNILEYSCHFFEKSLSFYIIVAFFSFSTKPAGNPKDEEIPKELAALVSELE